MKMTAFVIDCKDVRMLFNQEAVSNVFDLCLEYAYPNWSEDLERIDSNLDKASEMNIFLTSKQPNDPFTVTMSLELYRQLLRFVQLSMTYTDNYTQAYDFSHVGDIFRNATDHICYLRTKVFLRDTLQLNFCQDSELFAQMIMNTPKTQDKKFNQAGGKKIYQSQS